MVEIQCCLKSCGGLLSQDTDKAEVKSFVPNLIDTSVLLVNWGPNGEAAFHEKCWNQLVKSSRYKKKLFVSPIEKQMVTEASKTVEYHCSDDKMEYEAQRVAEMIRNAEYGIAFTGAGISTSAGIGDFRGRSGKWTENDRVKSYGLGVMPSNNQKGFSYEELRPTYSHEAMAYLVQNGFIKHVISQNCDGIHELSGIPTDKLWELHGNVFHEKCEKCEKRYRHPYYAAHTGRALPPDVPHKHCPTCGISHRTGRKCAEPGCGGYLMNTIINFGDRLEEAILAGAENAAQRNDLVLCLGTSLRVTPANSLVELGNPIRLVICNRQTTPCDQLCFVTEGGVQLGSRVYCDCDRFMCRVMSHLLPADELECWEGGRQQRFVEYSTRRWQYPSINMQDFM